MKNRKYFFAGLIALSLVLVGCSFVGTTKEDMSEAESFMADPPPNAGHYEEYTPERYDELLGSERFVLFFHADWCPTCRALEAKIKKNLGALNKHTVLEANYDRETALKKEYGVMVQTTVIFIDENGAVEDKEINPSLNQLEQFFN